MTPPPGAPETRTAGGGTPAPGAAAGRAAVTRIGTQVVVRLSGRFGEAERALLDGAHAQVAELALRRVVIDLDEVEELGEVGVRFLDRLADGWSTRLLNVPPGLAAPRRRPR